MFMSSLGPCSLAVTFSEGFCFQQRRLSSYGVSCKLEVRKKIATSCKINSQIQLTLVGAAAKSSSWDPSPPSSFSSNAWWARLILHVLADSQRSAAAASSAPVISKLLSVFLLPEHNHGIRTNGSDLLRGETLVSRRLPIRSCSLCGPSDLGPSDLWHCGNEMRGDNGLPGYKVYIICISLSYSTENSTEKFTYLVKWTATRLPTWSRHVCVKNDPRISVFALGMITNRIRAPDISIGG